jgi:hypothetical protein
MLSFSPFIHADGTWIKADGFAPMTSGKLVARRQALVEAYRQAISSGGIIEVGGYSQVSNFATVADVINTRVHGYIRRYKIVSEGVDELDASIYKVTINAQVTNLSDQDDDEGLSSFLSLIGVPTILFLAAGEPENDRMSTSENLLAAQFKQAGYKVMTADDVELNMDITPSVLRKAREGHGYSASLVGRASNADIVLTGTVTTELSDVNGGTDVQASIGIVSMALKVLIPSNGSIVDAANGTGRFMSVANSSALLAKQKATQQAANQLTELLKWRIPKYLSQQPRVIAVRVVKLPFDKLTTFETFLTGLSGVDKVETVNWKQGNAQFQIESAYTGPKEMDIINAMQSEFAQLTVNNYRPYQISLSL